VFKAYKVRLVVRPVNFDVVRGPDKVPLRLVADLSDRCAHGHHR
jgi:hypothetical protein